MFKEKLMTATLFVTSHNHLNIIGADVMDQLGIWNYPIELICNIIRPCWQCGVMHFVHICGDYSTRLNECMEMHTYPLPLNDDIFVKCKIFTRIDLSDAYMQLKVGDST